MLFLNLGLTSLLSTAILAAPTSLTTLQSEGECTPTSYTIQNFRYTETSSSASVSFEFTSQFPNTAIIDDPAQAGATCAASGATIPNSNECSTGRTNLEFDLRAPQEQAEYQIIHTWRCNGQTWMSSTPHKIDSLSCTTTGDSKECTSTAGQTFTPQNVRQICSTPTCP